MRKRIALTGVLFGVAVLSACSSQAAPAAPQVASVQTSDAAPAAGQPSPQGQPSPTAERPRFRIDMTDDEQEALYDPYRKCMSDHGIDLRDRGKPSFKPDKEKLAQASKDCDPLLPLPAWENDIDNPEAFDFNRRVVTCLRANGVKYVEVNKDEETGMVGPSFGGQQNDADSIDKGLKFTPQCQQEVANGGYR